MDGTRQFGGRRALVTGAGKGVSRAVATMLATRGAEVVAMVNGACLEVDGGSPQARRRKKAFFF